LIPATIHLFKGPTDDHMHVRVCVCVWCGGMGCLHRTWH